MLPLLRGVRGVSFFDFKIDMFNQTLNNINNKINVLKEASAGQTNNIVLTHCICSTRLFKVVLILT